MTPGEKWALASSTSARSRAFFLAWGVTGWADQSAWSTTRASEDADSTIIGMSSRGAGCTSGAGTVLAEATTVAAGACAVVVVVEVWDFEAGSEQAAARSIRGAPASKAALRNFIMDLR